MHTTTYEALPPGISTGGKIRTDEADVLDACWSPDGNYFAVASTLKVVIYSSKTKKRMNSFNGHPGPLTALSWSPDSSCIVSGCQEGTLNFWNVSDGLVFQRVTNLKPITCLSWSSKNDNLAIGTSSGEICFFNFTDHRDIQLIYGHDGSVTCISWAPDGSAVASGSIDNTVKVWRGLNKTVHFNYHKDIVTTLTWSKDSNTLATGSRDKTIAIWDTKAQKVDYILEGNVNWIDSAVFTNSGELLISKSSGGMICVWETYFWKQIAKFPQPIFENKQGLCAHPSEQSVASYGHDGNNIYIWKFKDYLTSKSSSASANHYKNAKVALVGDSGVGKTGLRLVLSNSQYTATESTHGRVVASFDRYTSKSDSVNEERETLIWDLAGQSGYRIFHLLSLHDVTIGLVIIDARSETNPFSGVDFWSKALDQFCTNMPLRKFLVIARADRGTLAVSEERIQRVVKENNFDGVLEVSAKTGMGIQKLKRLIHTSIRWNEIPTVTTPKQFAAVMNFVNEKKEGEYAITTRHLLEDEFKVKEQDDFNHAVFGTCLDLLESSGIIRQLETNNVILLRPELLDQYCASLALAARSEPDGLGHISWEDAINGRFPKDAINEINKEEEAAIIISTTKEVVKREIAFLAQTDSGDMIVFPSELRRDVEGEAKNEIMEIRFLFDGPVAAIYATLAVKIIYSDTFTLKQSFKNVTVFSCLNHSCSICCNYEDEDSSSGEILVAFSPNFPGDKKLLLLRYINQQLAKLALKKSIHRERIYHCHSCNYMIPRSVVFRRIEMKEKFLICPICLSKIEMDNIATESEKLSAEVGIMQAKAVEERKRTERVAVYNIRKNTSNYHAILWHGEGQPGDIDRFERKLRYQGIHVFSKDPEKYTKDDLKEINNTNTIIFAVGARWKDPWINKSYIKRLLKYLEFRERENIRLNLIPVFMPGAPDHIEIPLKLLRDDFVSIKSWKGTNDIKRLVDLILAKSVRFEVRSKISLMTDTGRFIDFSDAWDL